MDLPSISPLSRRDVEQADRIVTKFLGAGSLSRIVENGGVIARKSFASQDMQQYEMTGVTFEGCDFSGVAATGVTWTDNRFVDCRFDGVDLEFSDLSRCHFLGKLACGHAPRQDGDATIVGAGFNGVVLRGAHLTGIASQHSSFAYADFTGSTISDCSFNGTFEGCLFHGASLTGSSFLETNISFADFTEATFNDVAIGLKELPDLFGIKAHDVGRGLQVFAVDGGAAHKTLSEADLREVGPHLMVAYESKRNYFAAANMAHILGITDRLIPLIVAGMRDAGFRSDCRGLKLLCRLARQIEDSRHLFGPTVLRHLYEMITAAIAASPDGVRNQYQLHDGQIRADLLAAPPDRLEIQFQSLAENAAAATLVQGQVLDLLAKIAAAGLDFEVEEARFSFNSHPTHTFRVKRSALRHRALSGLEAKGPSPWLNFMVSVMTLAFTGLQAVSPLLETKQPPVVVQQVAISCHQEIKAVIVPESLLLKLDGLPVTSWEGGQLTLIQNQCSPQQPLRLGN